MIHSINSITDVIIIDVTFLSSRVYLTCKIFISNSLFQSNSLKCAPITFLIMSFNYVILLSR